MRLLTSSCLFVCLSVRTQQLENQRADLHENPVRFCAHLERKSLYIHMYVCICVCVCVCVCLFQKRFELKFLERNERYGVYPVHFSLSFAVSKIIKQK
jgi:hypothetical protein